MICIQIMHNIGTSKTRFLLFLHAANCWCLMSHLGRRGLSKFVLFCKLKCNLFVIWQPWVMHSFWLNCSYVIHILSDKKMIGAWYWIGASLVTIQTNLKISHYGHCYTVFLNSASLLFKGSSLRPIRQEGLF